MANNDTTNTNTVEADMPALYRWVTVKTWGKEGNEKPLFIAHMKNDGDVQFKDVSGENQQAIAELTEHGITDGNGNTHFPTDGRMFLETLSEKYGGQRITAGRIEVASEPPEELASVA